jgi:hypothetical protein
MRKANYTSKQGKSTNFLSNQGKTQAPPQMKPYGWQTPISSPQISKSRRMKGFGVTEPPQK